MVQGWGDVDVFIIFFLDINYWDVYVFFDGGDIGEFLGMYCYCFFGFDCSCYLGYCFGVVQWFVWVSLVGNYKFFCYRGDDLVGEFVYI